MEEKEEGLEENGREEGIHISTFDRSIKKLQIIDLIIIILINNIIICGACWCIGRFDAFRPKGRGFESRCSRHPRQALHAQLSVALRLETPGQNPCCVGSASE